MGEYGRADRYIQQPTTESVRNAAQHLRRDIIVVHTAPEQPDIQPAPPFSLRQYIVINIAGLVIGACDNNTPFDSFCFSSKPHTQYVPRAGNLHKSRSPDICHAGAFTVSFCHIAQPHNPA